MATLNDTDIFVVVENEEDDYDFVSIDEDVPYNPIIIDMSGNEFLDAITVDFEGNMDLDAFVMIDEDPIFLSDFTEDDLLN